jgi:TolA-binding protein
MKTVVLLVSLIVSQASFAFITRSQMKEAEAKKQIQSQVSDLQKMSADNNQRFSELEAELRNALGRIEVLEREAQLSARGVQDQQAAQLSKINTLKEEMIKMDAQMQAMQSELEKLRVALAASVDSGAVSGGSVTSAKEAAPRRDLFNLAEQEFDKKEWRKAILAYQKYRETFPKGKNVPEAIYKMGVSFQELGMKDEAKTFYEEVIAKYPKSPEARKSQTRLKSLKK